MEMINFTGKWNKEYTLNDLTLSVKYVDYYFVEIIIFMWNLTDDYLGIINLFYLLNTG